MSIGNKVWYAVMLLLGLYFGAAAVWNLLLGPGPRSGLGLAVGLVSGVGAAALLTFSIRGFQRVTSERAHGQQDETDDT